MRRRLPRGLRPRLLLALLVTSAVTLGVAAIVVLSRSRTACATRAPTNLRGGRARDRGAPSRRVSRDMPYDPLADPATGRGARALVTAP